MDDYAPLCALHTQLEIHGPKRKGATRKKGDAMTLREFLYRKSDETDDQEGVEMAPLAHIRIAHAYEDGVMVSGLAAETLPKSLRRRCMEAVIRYQGEISQEPSWLFIDSAEEEIVVR